MDANIFLFKNFVGCKKIYHCHKHLSSSLSHSVDSLIAGYVSVTGECRDHSPRLLSHLLACPRQGVKTVSKEETKDVYANGR